MRATSSRASKPESAWLNSILTGWLTRLALALMQALGRLPLPWLRRLGAVLGWLLYRLAWSRRRVVETNLLLCFPQHSMQQRRALVRQTFVYFGQAWLDRAWLWRAAPALLRQRLQLSGEVDALRGSTPTLLFAPHFVGLDAGWSALTLLLDRPLNTLYTPQHNRVIDAWVLAGRQRFGTVRLRERAGGAKAVVSALRAGQALYLLPDMNFGPDESLFVPFFGVPAATVPSLSRFARLTRARVVPVLTRLTPTGYEVQVLPAWQNFPGDDAAADTALMNRRLQDWIMAMPAQYYWVHKRFKTRPPGEAQLY